MGSHTEKKQAGARNSRFLATAFNKTLSARIIFAAVLLIASLFVKDSKALTILLRSLSLVISACDVVYDAVMCVAEGRFLNTPLLYITVALASMLTGNTAEGAMVCLIYQAGQWLLKLISQKEAKRALSYLRNGEEKETLKQVLEYRSAPELGITGSISKTFMPLMLALVVIGLLYLIILPVFGHLNSAIALRRSLVMVLLAEPAVLFSSFRSLGIKGLCIAAEKGTVFNSALGLNDTTGNYVVYSENQKSSDYVGVMSHAMERDSFINFVVHLLCTSRHNFADFIINYYNLPYDENLICEKRDVEGGVEGSINGKRVIFGTYEMLERYGIDVDNPISGRYYMYLGDRYVGCMYIEYGESPENSFLELGRKVDAFAVENASITFVIKAVMLILAFTGYLSISIAALGAVICGIVTVINSRRLDYEPNGFDNLFYKYFK